MVIRAGEWLRGRASVLLSIPIFVGAFYVQALDGVAIQVELVFAFRNNEVIEAASFVVGSPCVTQIPRPARAGGIGEIPDVRVADRPAVRAGQHGDVADMTAAVKADNGVLISLVMAEDPNLLALILGLELGNLNQPRARLSIGHS